MSNTSLLKAELYKLVNHRAPRLTAGALLAGVLATPAVLLFYTPSDTSVYADGFTQVFSLLGPLVAAVFGGWLLGTEYRQDTVKRFLAVEPRRGRALAAKAAAGFVAFGAILAGTAVAGWGFSRFVGSLNEVAVPWNGRQLLAIGVYSVAVAAVAFGLSAITKSDSFATVGTVGLVLVLDPLLTLVPKIGKYSFGSALETVTDKIWGGQTELFASAGNLSTATAMATMTLWLVGFIGVGSYLFSTRDV